MPIFNSERDFEDQICEFIEENKVNPINDRPVIHMLRQPNFGRLGIADLVTLESHGESLVINVIELKNVPYASGMLFQLSRYLLGTNLGTNLKHTPHDLFLSGGGVELIDSGVKVIGSLVCTDFSQISDGELSFSEMLNIKIYAAKMIMLSVSFEKHPEINQKITEHDIVFCQSFGAEILNINQISKTMKNKIK